MDPNSNRLHLNFGLNDRNYNPANNRVYPTTPSAFPQPIYQSQDFVDPHAPQNQGYGQNYFMNNPYVSQQHQQAHYNQQQYAQHSLQSPQPTYQTRMGYNLNTYNNANDGTNGLIQQFSNQDLGSSPRGELPPVTGQRPRTAGSPQPSHQQASHLVPPMPNRSPKPAIEEEELQRHSERYSENVHKRGKAAKELISVFFQENIERARERNMR